jgi:threonine dehydrogenase-like Zn-dependent dehydrogenase
VARSGLVDGQRALVTGAGPIGLLTVAVLRAKGIADITVSEPAPGRRQRALAIGAKQAIAPDELPPVPRHPADLADPGFDAAIDCSGRADAMEAGLGLLGRAGTLVLSGTGMKRPRFDANRIILNELVVTGSVEYTRDDYHEAISILTDGHLPVEQLIEPDDVPLAGMQAAMELLMTGELPGKVLVAPGA